MRILGLDYGSKTVGVAVCDPLGMTAQGVETITRKEENKLRKTLARIEALVEEYQVETIVLGYPKNMDDSIGNVHRKRKNFAICWYAGSVCLSFCGTSALQLLK